MLDTYKKAHESCADAYIKEDWRRMNKNALLNRYVDVEKDPVLADAYFSAIVCRYWGAISKYYNSSRKVVDATVCYDWLIHALMWAVQHKKWLEPGNKLVGDPNGPDKVVNRCIVSARLGFFQSSNTHRRRLNYGLESLDYVMEDEQRNALVPAVVDDDLDEGTLSITQMISDAFDKKDYVMAFLIDGIINYNVFEDKKEDNKVIHNVFNRKKLLRHLRAMNSAQSRTFAELYHKPLEEVNSAVRECTALSRVRLKTAVDRSMKQLAKHYSRVLEEY